jgi:hypothetical protein
MTKTGATTKAGASGKAGTTTKGTSTTKTKPASKTQRRMLQTKPATTGAKGSSTTGAKGSTTGAKPATSAYDKYPLPKLGDVLNAMETALFAYLKDKYSAKFTDIEAVYDLIQEDLYDPAGPNMLGILNLAKEVGLNAADAGTFRTDVKSWMKTQVETWIKGTNLTATEKDTATKSVVDAFSGLTDEEFMGWLGKALRGEVNLDALKSFASETGDVNFGNLDQIGAAILADIKSTLNKELK